MRITRNQLRRIIKEEKTKLLKEMWGSEIETGSSLLDFAHAWSGLGSVIQEQILALANAYILQGGHEPEWGETVRSQNAAAIERAQEKLRQPLTRLRQEGLDEAEYVLDMLNEALDIDLGDEDVAEDGYRDGVTGKPPALPDNDIYMTNYEDGKKDA